MKRHLLIFALLPGFKSSWRQTTGGQAQVLQMEKPVAKFNIQKLLATILLALIIPLWSSVALAQVSQTWYSGSGNFTVPKGVTQVTIAAVGGAGGAGGEDCGNGCGYNYGVYGQYTSGTYNVTPESTLSYYVGASGSNGGSGVGGGGAGAGGWGYYAGGRGGNTGSQGTSGGGGGGGGASAVTSGGSAILIAGGGGGGGGRCNTAGSGTGGYTSAGGGSYGSGTAGSDSGGDGAGGGGGGGGYVGGGGGGHYSLNGEWAAYGGYSGSSSPAGSYSGSSPYITISYTAVGGTASASSPTVCSGGSSTISLSGWAGTSYTWWYSTNGSNYYQYGASNTSITPSGLTSTTYYKADVNGTWSSVATVTIYALTSAPSYAATTGTTQSTAGLSWGAGSGQGTLTYYWVVGTSSNVTHPSPGNNGTYYGTTTGTSGSASGLSANTTYYLRVYANAACGNSVYTNSAGFMTVPLAPVATTATDIRANSFTANWTASTSGATGYYIDVSRDNFSTYLSGYNNRSVGNVTSISLSGLNRNTTYYYRVRASNPGGQSVNSNTITPLTLDLNNFLVEKAATGAIANQTAGVAFNIKITARDSYNTTVTDFTGTTTITTNSTLTAGGTTAAFSAGTLASHSVTLTLAGASKTLTATYSGSPTTTGTSNTFTVLPNILHHFTLAPDGTITAGTAFTVTATAYDVYNNVKTNYGGLSTDLNYTGTNSVNWSTTALSAPKGIARIIPANGNKTFTNGVSAGITGFTFYNSDQTQIAPLTSLTITISDLATSKQGTTTPMTVLNAPLDNFKVVAGITQNAGIAFSTTVTARDIYLNTCVDYGGSIRFKSSDDALVVFPAGLQSFAPANTNRGVMTYTGGVRIDRIGAYWLRAADSQFAYKSGEQQNIVVSPGAFLKTASISTLDVDNLNKIAGEEVVVTLIPHDAKGNLLYACQTISVLLDGVVKSGTHQVAHGTDTGSDGVYVFHVPVTSTTVNNIISATFQDPVTSAITAFDQTRDITVTPAPPSLTHTIITPNAGSMTTNGQQIVTVQLYDVFDNLRTTDDGVVSLSTSLGGFGSNNGNATNFVTTYDGSTSGSYSAILYASYNASNNGVGTAGITGSVAFNATPGPGVWSGSAWPANGSITDGASVAISEGLPDLITSTLVSDKSTMTTDGTATLTLQLKDFLGNLITHNRGAVTLTSDRGVMVNHSYLSAGQYTYTLTAGTTAVNGVGLATISGSFTGSGTASGVTGPFNDDVSPTANTITTVNITEGLPALATIDISTAAAQITADDLTAGGQTVVTVQLKDALGNLIVNNRGTVTLSTNLGVIYNGTSTGATDIQATYLSPGKYTATLKMNAIGVGTATITGKYNTAAISDNAQVTVINGLATQLAISTPPAQAYQPIAGIAFNAQPVIYIKDHYGNLVVTGTGSTDQVTATRITNGTAALQGTLTKTAVAGIATFTDLSYNVAELINIQFTSGTLTSQTSAAVNVVHNVPSYLVITGTGTQTAGVAQTITIRAYDAYNNLANRFAGNKSLTFTGANLSPTPPYYPTVGGIHLGSATLLNFTAGVATGSMILYKEETVDIAANFTIGSYVDPAGFTSNTAVNIDAASTNRLHVVVSQAVPAYLAITGSANQVAGEAQVITIRAYDSFNNPATGYTGDKTLSFSGANVSLVPSTSPTVGGVAMGSDKVLTFTNGVATASMVLYKVENISVMATDIGSSGITTAEGYKLAVSVSHASANYYAVTGTGTETAGAAQTITVKAYDAWNNQATTYAGDIPVTFSGANPSPNTPNAATNPTVANYLAAPKDFGSSTTITFTGGVATRSMVLYKVETAHIVASSTGITTPVITGYDYRLAVAVNHAANSFFAITGAGTQTAGVSQNISVTMYDAYNNVATGYTGAQSLTFSGANPSPNTPNAATNPIVNSIAFGTSTSLTFASGTVTTAMNLYKVETALVTATNGTQTADSHKLSVAVSHADQNFMAITGTGTQTAGVSQNITVTAYDAFNNVATRFTGAKSLTFSGATVAPAYSPTPATSPVVSATAFGTATSLTFASGVVTTAMNLYKVETALVTATNTDGSITITADTHKLSVVVGQSSPAYLAVTGTGTQGAGANQTITITAYDAYNNLATAYTGSKNLVFTGANASAAAVASNNMPTPTTPATNPTVASTAFGTGKAFTFASGVTTGTMTLYKTETALVSVTDATISSFAAPATDHRLSVLVNPALLYGFLVYNVPDPHDLGTWQSVTVQAIDTYNNTKTNYVGTITFSNTDIAATNPADYHFVVGDAGIHTFTDAVKFSQVGLDWWLTALDLAEPVKYGAQSGITVQRAITIASAPDGQTKTYGDVKDLGTTAFTISEYRAITPPADYHITGVTLSSDGTIATASVASSPYTITPSLATGSYDPNLFHIFYVSTGGKLTVNPKPLTIGAPSIASKAYNATPTAGAVTVGSLSGFYSTETVTATAVAADYTSPNYGTYDGTVVTYTLANGTNNGIATNYSLANGTATGSVTKKALTAATLVADKIYNASAVTGTVTLGTVSGMVNTETLAITPTASNYGDANVANGKATTISYALADGSNGGLAANYSMANLSTTGNITQKALTASTTVSDKVYNGSPVTGTVTLGAVTGMVGSETLVITPTASNYADANVANGKATTISYGLANGTNGGLAANYSMATLSTTGNVTKQALTAATTVADKVYNGSPVTGTVTLGSVTGLVGSEALTITPTASDYSNANVANGKATTISYALANGTGGLATNYSMATLSTTGNVTRKALSVTSPLIASKDYDASTTAGSVTVGTLSGFVTGETVTATGVAANYSSKNVASYPGVVVTYTLIDGTGGGLAANYSLATGTATGVITQKALSVTSPSIASKVYDSNTNAGAVTVGTLSGFIGSETVTATGVSAAYSSANVGTYTGNVVTYTLHDGTVGGLAGNYSLASGTATGIITQKALSVTPPSIAARDYNATTTAGAVTVGTLSGFIGSETVTATGAAANYSSKNVGTYPGNVVTYTLYNGTNNGLAANYSLANGTASGIINQLHFDVTAVYASKTYDGGMTSNGAPTFGAFPTGDVVNGTPTQVYDNKNVGSTHVMTASGLTIKDALEANMTANYDIHYNNVATGVIIKLDITGTFTVTSTKVYDGNNTATINGRGLVGVLSGDLGKIKLTGGSATYSDKNVADGKTVTSAGMSLAADTGGDETGNYNLTGVATTTANITPRDLHLYTFAANSKTYDGNTLATGMGWQDDRLGTDQLSFQWTALFDSKDVGARNVNYSNIVIFAGTDKLNYNLVTPTADVAKASANITARPLTLTATGVNREYDGTDVATITFTDNKVSGDVYTVNYSATFNNQNVGNAKPVSVTGISLSGTDALNYSLAATTASTTANITTKVLTIGGSLTANHKAYDGGTTATGTTSGLTLATKVGSEDVSLTSVVLNFANSAVQNTKTVSISSAGLTGANAGNYSLSLTGAPTATANITQKVLTIGGSITANNKEYDGGTTATIDNNGLNLVTKVGSEAVSLNAVVLAFADAALQNGKSVSISSAGLIGADAGNYSLSLTGAPTTLANITQKVLTIGGSFTANDKSYDGGTTATGTTTGLTLVTKVGSEDVSLNAVVLGFATSAVANSKPVSISSAGLTGANAGNYSLSLTGAPTATANITQKVLTIGGSFTADNKQYDGGTNATGTTTGLTLAIKVGSEDVTINMVVLAFADAALGTGKTVSISSAGLTGTHAGNYSLSLSGAPTTSADVIQKVLTIGGSFTANNKEYDGGTTATINNNSLTLVTKVGTEDVSLNAVVLSFATSAVANTKTVSIASAGLTGVKAGNYSLSLTGAPVTTADITAKTITISPDAGQSKLVGAVDPAFTYTYSPALYSGDGFTGALGRNTGTGTDVGNYSYTMGTLSAGTNYNLVMTSSPATFAIMRNTQDIALIAGWNMISSGIIPANPDMLSVFNTLIGGSKLIKIMNESGEPVENVSGWQNYIGNISSTEGYKVKVTTACTLTVAGNSVSLPLAIPLGVGWNIISFPASGNQNGLTALQALITAGKLEKVMDERGAAIEDWTAYGFGWQNNIGNFAPGKGYLVKVNDVCTVTINEVLNKAATVTPELIASSYFKTAFTGNGFDHMSINLIDLQKSGIRQGDEIGIFDGTVCVGAATIGADQMISGNMSIPVSANDGLSETINGYIAGNPVRLKLYSNGVESSLRTEIQNNVPAVFKKGESLFLKVSTDAATGISSLSQTLDVKFYPNPFTDVLSVEINSSGEKPIDIMIYDVLGRKIRSLFTGSVNGSQIIRWDGTSDGGSVVRPGIYYMRCNGLMFNGIIKR